MFEIFNISSFPRKPVLVKACPHENGDGGGNLQLQTEKLKQNRYKKLKNQVYMDYSKIGSQLKLARERKGLSYYQIFEVTRIQPSILKDIEEGTASMAPVFLKSFIKIYCRFLGLDFEKLTQATVEKSKGKEKNETIYKYKNIPMGKEEETNIKSKLQYLLPILGLLAVFQLMAFLDLPKKIFKKSSAKNEIYTAGQNHLEEKEETQQQWDAETANSGQTLPSQTLFEKIKQSVFKQEVLIQSSNQLNIYFKMDDYFIINKTIQPFVWFYIKARQSIYLRLDDKKGEIQVFHNGEQIDLGPNSFFERKFE